MYRVLVVDDEPAAIRHICAIIATQCPLFEVTATAEHGQTALQLIEQSAPDVLITDVKMSGMDGIALANKVKERHPEIFSLVVSGYQEFEYAKAALKTGVYDYLLKPLHPSVLKTTLDSLAEQLDAMYAKKRNLILKSLCEKAQTPPDQVARYFPEDQYYAAIVRKNALPRRYFGNFGVEIFSGRDEKIHLYGRDEMEALYLCPESVLAYKSFYRLLSETIDREYRDSNFVTGLIRETPFSIDTAAQVFEELYQLLDSRIVVGESQILIVEELGGQAPGQQTEETNLFCALETAVQRQHSEKVLETVDALFACWKRGKRPQMYVEAQVRYLLVLLDKSGFMSGLARSSEHILDDIFYSAENMGEVSRSIQAILAQALHKESTVQKMDTADFFARITAYLENHLAEPLSMKLICEKFGLSPTYLSKLFRKYSTHSFNQFLTLARIARAKELLKNDTPAYIKDVAASVGYNDPFYFSRIFTSVVGVCPSDFLAQRDNL